MRGERNVHRKYGHRSLFRPKVSGTLKVYGETYKQTNEQTGRRTDLFQDAPDTLAIRV